MATETPEQGQLVQVRSRHYVVLDVDEYADSGDVSRKVRLECLDDDALGNELEVVWEREVGATVHDTSRLPRPDGFDPLDRFLAYTLALRWSSSSVIAGPPLTAPFYGAVEIEPYQLVPVVRALQMHRVSLLLADDVGLGKTVEAGLVAQELLRRHRARRIMIVCPASLQLQWQQGWPTPRHRGASVGGQVPSTGAAKMRNPKAAGPGTGRPAEVAGTYYRRVT